MTSRRAWRIFGSAALAILLGVSAQAQASLQISSPAFAPGKPLPAGCGRQHGNVSPELAIHSVPARAKSLVLIVDDPDAPAGLWTHWLVWNIPPGTPSLSSGAVPPDARQGKNSFDATQYDGPQPPYGVHRYFFHLYALDILLDLPEGADRTALTDAMAGHVIAKTESMGTYAADR